MEKSDVASLIEALCDAGADGQAEASTAMLALRREAAKALLDSALLDRAGADDAAVVDPDRVAATLAALLSGADAEAALRALADRAMRLNAESAFAFVDAIEQSAEPAPSHLVEDLICAAVPATSRGTAAPSLRLRIADRFWPAQRWRLVGACVAVLIASAASVSLYWEAPERPAIPHAPVATSKITTSAPAIAADAPAAPSPALATTEPCELPPQIGIQAGASAPDESRPPAHAVESGHHGTGDCSTALGNRLSDTAIQQELERADQARQAAAAQAAAAAATAEGARRHPGPTHADRSDGMFDAERHRPAAARAAPAAKPAAPAAVSPLH
ncbi:hypothetical protein ACFFWD_13095 [Bradyrhizobium erythrophlei]|uniref:hypothetical protein n=1 Tax=Bradyrhizobium erythrophlei TaxID=1437360 RepID=UPI0035E8393B